MSSPLVLTGNNKIVTYLPLVEGTGTTAYNYGSVSGNGTITNATWGKGTNGKYFLKYNGSNTYMALGSFPTGTDWSVFTWIYPTTLSAEYHIFGSIDTGTNSVFNFRSAADNTFNVYLRGDGGAGQQPSYSGTLTLNAWQMVGITSDSSNIVLYLDTVGETTAKSWTGTFNLNTPPLVGARINIATPGSYWYGYIGEVLIYNKAITLAEIKALYRATYRV